jgi:ABC-type nitrate/sulfonate/bicarbonate transport system permease component
MSLVIWLPIWAIPANPNTARHHVAVVTVAILLALVHWTYRSDIDCNASSHREFLDADMSSPNGASWWATIGVYLFMLVAWQVIANLDYFNATPARTLLAAIKLIAAADLWRDMLTSLSEIFSGIIFSGILVLVISATLLKRLSSAKCLLSILSLTFALPIIIWPTWFGWLLSWGTQSNTLVWHVTCVACLTFYPLLSTYWTLRDKPAFYRTLLAIEQALPYGFVAILYSEMMAATSGLVFSIVVAVADNQTEKAFAIFLITLSLMLVLSLVFRLLARKSDLFMRSDVFPEPGVMKPSNST